jgi:hypothetical protein
MGTGTGGGVDEASLLPPPPQAARLIAAVSTMALVNVKLSKARLNILCLTPVTAVRDPLPGDIFNRKQQHKS